jgi:hypothetical protein
LAGELAADVFADEVAHLIHVHRRRSGGGGLGFLDFLGVDLAEHGNCGR